jgi:thiamine-phosphate pyrophosphorylase
MILHAIVADAASALWASRHGATVVQLRLKGATTADRVRVGREVLARLGDGARLVMNDDVEAALTLGTWVHLGQGDPGMERALQAGLGVGRSSSSVDEAVRAEMEGAAYVGAGPVWATPSKPDAWPAIGLGGLAEVCRAVRVPVVAIGGIDAANAAACLGAGAAGVAVIRAVSELPRLRVVLETARAEAAGARPASAEGAR